MNTLGAQFQSDKDEETASYWKALGKILEPLARPFSKEPGKILVMDGNGAVGYRVAKLLLAAGYDHNKLIIATDELHAIPDLAAAAEVVMFDWDGDEYHYAEGKLRKCSLLIVFEGIQKMCESTRIHLRDSLCCEFISFIYSFSSALTNF